MATFSPTKANTKANKVKFTSGNNVSSSLLAAKNTSIAQGITSRVDNKQVETETINLNNKLNIKNDVIEWPFSPYKDVEYNVYIDGECVGKTDKNSFKLSNYNPTGKEVDISVVAKSTKTGQTYEKVSDKCKLSKNSTVDKNSITNHTIGWKKVDTNIDDNIKKISLKNDKENQATIDITPINSNNNNTYEIYVDGVLKKEGKDNNYTIKDINKGNHIVKVIEKNAKGETTAIQYTDIKIEGNWDKSKEIEDAQNHYKETNQLALDEAQQKADESQKKYDDFYYKAKAVCDKYGINLWDLIYSNKYTDEINKISPGDGSKSYTSQVEDNQEAQEHGVTPHGDVEVEGGHLHDQREQEAKESEHKEDNTFTYKTKEKNNVEVKETPTGEQEAGRPEETTNAVNDENKKRQEDIEKQNHNAEDKFIKDKFGCDPKEFKEHFNGLVTERTYYAKALKKYNHNVDNYKVEAILNYKAQDLENFKTDKKDFSDEIKDEDKKDTYKEACEYNPTLAKKYYFLKENYGADIAQEFVDAYYDTAKQSIAEKNIHEDFEQTLKNGTFVDVAEIGMGDGIGKFFEGLWDQNGEMDIHDYETEMKQYLFLSEEEKKDMGLLTTEGKATEKGLNGNSKDYSIDWTKDHSDSIDKTAYGVGNSIGYMTPVIAASIGITAATGGAGAVAIPGIGTVSTASLSTFTTFSLIFASTAGNSYDDAKIRGVSESSAIAYALINGISEAGLETMLGNIPGIGANKVTGLASFLKTLPAEIGQEELQTMVGLALDHYILGEEIDLSQVKDALKDTAINSALVSFAMNAPSVAVSSGTNFVKYCKEHYNLIISNSSAELAININKSISDLPADVQMATLALAQKENCKSKTNFKLDEVVESIKQIENKQDQLNVLKLYEQGKITDIKSYIETGGKNYTQILNGIFEKGYIELADIKNLSKDKSTKLLNKLKNMKDKGFNVITDNQIISDVLNGKMETDFAVDHIDYLTNAQHPDLILKLFTGELTINDIQKNGSDGNKIYDKSRLSAISKAISANNDVEVNSEIKEVLEEYNKTNIKNNQDVQVSINALNKLGSIDAIKESLNSLKGKDLVDVISKIKDQNLVEKLLSDSKSAYMEELTSHILSPALDTYEKAAKLASKEEYSAFTTYRAHTESHVREVAEKTMEAAKNIKNALAKNNIEGYSKDFNFYEAYVAALWHDTGMAAGAEGLIGLDSYIDENGNIATRTLNETKNGNKTRKNHSFNSAMMVLQNADKVSEMGVDPNKVALLAFSHSKSNSGVRSLNSSADWSVCISKINNAVEFYNKEHSDNPIKFDGGKSFLESLVESGILKDTEFTVKEVYDDNGKLKYRYNEYHIDESAVKELASGAYALRLGDANTNNRNIGTNQAGQKIDIDSLKGNFHESFIFDKNIKALVIAETTGMNLEEVKRRMKLSEDDPQYIDMFKNNKDTGFTIKVGDKTVTLDSGSIAFILGENNIDFNTKVNSEGYMTEVFTITDPSKVPAATAFNIQERLGEIDTATDFDTVIEINLNSNNISAEQKVEIEKFYNDLMDNKVGEGRYKINWI
ncbi:MAG: hypothetical protein IJ880_02300 [Bacilli bacterium]|nr:hypothetical protein [Bacilli bacterium]